MEGDGPAFTYPNTFRLEKTSGPDRLKIGASEAHISLVYKLGSELRPPFYLLYLLHTSRCDQELGRYQSPALDWAGVNLFLAEFCEFLTDDGRHDFWIRSNGSDATLIWDRHNLIYAYGPLLRFREILVEHGLRGGPVEWSVPHTHHYHAQYDAAERRVLRYFRWEHSPLEAGDEQF